MNVFVLCTGRCGSVAFARACAHATNYSVGHETHLAHFGRPRLDYPADHVEVDNRLAWFLGRLHARYGDEALYVHLTRDPRAVAASYARRFQPGLLLHAYGRGLHVGMPDTLDLEALASDMVTTITANIELFLAARPKTMRIAIEDISSDFPRFWERVGASGDLAVALTEFDQGHNTGPPVLPPGACVPNP